MTSLLFPVHSLTSIHKQPVEDFQSLLQHNLGFCLLFQFDELGVGTEDTKPKKQMARNQHMTEAVKELRTAQRGSSPPTASLGFQPAKAQPGPQPAEQHREEVTALSDKGQVAGMAPGMSHPC